MDSQFGETFLFLTNLAWKLRITLPVLVTAVFMVMDIRLQIEINVQTGQVAADIEDEFDEESDNGDEIGSQASWETIDSDEHEDDDTHSEQNHN